MFRRVLKAISKQQNDMAYIHALLLDQEHGVMDSLLPQVLESYYPLFKANKRDPDVLILAEATAGPHREQFLEAMKKEIEELEEHDTWSVVRRADLPSGCHVIPSTWALKIKRYPDGRLRKFKGRFCARGDKQVEGVDYSEKWAPTVSWSTVRILLCLALNQGWVTKQVDFSNAFVQATLDKDVYVLLLKCSLWQREMNHLVHMP